MFIEELLVNMQSEIELEIGRLKDILPWPAKTGGNLLARKPFVGASASDFA
ncbi:MAG: hypothetical protein GXP05_00405 [Alphaproteobacteria bacterium]|nr:hypothetical protein [Alphaproteobacteria bacterium]